MVAFYDIDKYKKWTADMSMQVQTTCITLGMAKATHTYTYMVYKRYF